MINKGYTIEVYDNKGIRHQEHLTMTDDEYALHNVLNEWVWRGSIPQVSFSTIGPHPIVNRPAFVIFAVSCPCERLVLMEHDRRYYYVSECVDCGYENYGNVPPSIRFRAFYFCPPCRKASRQLLSKLGFKKMGKKIVK